MSKLGVQIIGDAAGLKAALGESLAATQEWATETEGAAVRVTELFKGVTSSELGAAVAADKLAMAVGRYGTESLGAAQATLRYRQQIESMQRSQLAAAGALGGTLTRNVTLPVAIAAGASIKLGMDFEDAMQLIHTQAGASESEVTRLSARMLDLAKSGQSFGQSAKDMANGLFYVESEGVRGARALEITRVAAAGAAVGQTSLAETTNALTSAMRVFNVPTGQAAQTMATLNAAVGAGKMHLEDLNAALGTKFLPTAKQLGITLPQALAALDVFTRAGVPAQAAATNLTTAFIKFEAPTKASTTALAKMGLGSKELANQLNSGGLPAALGLLAQKYDQVVKSQGRVAANQDIINAFGGIKGGSSVLTLVQQYDTYLAGLKQVQEQSNPATFWADVSAQMNLPSQKIKQDVAAITAQMIDVGTKLAPLAADAANDIDKIASAIDKLPGPMKSSLGWLAVELALGGPIITRLVGLTKLAKTVGLALGGIGATAAPGLAAAKGEIAATGEAAVVAEAEVSTLQASLLGLSAIVIPPIVIPIVEKYLGKYLNGPGNPAYNIGGSLAGGGNNTPTGVDTTGSLAYAQQLIRQGKTDDQIMAALYSRYPNQFTTDGLPDKSLLRHEVAAARNAGSNVTGGAGQHGASRTNVAGGRGLPSRSTGKTTPAGGGKPTPLTQAQNIAIELYNAQLAFARGDAGSKQRLVAALKAQISFDERDAQVQENLLKAGKGNRKAELAVLQSDLSEASSDYGQIKSLANQDAATRKKAADAAKKAAAARKKAAATLNIPLALQLEQAKADASGVSSQQQKAAQAIKDWAEALIKSGKLTTQQLIQAYQDIAQENGILGTQTSGLNNSLAASAAKMTAGLGLSRSQRVALESRIAQAEAHGGRIPKGVGAGGGMVIEGDVHVHGVHDEDQLVKTLQRKAKHGTAQRRGPHAGKYLGLH